MSVAIEHPGKDWLSLRCQVTAGLTRAEVESVLRHPLALEPEPVVELLRASARPEPIVVPAYEGVDHLHVNLCGAGNSASHIRAEHKAVGLILAELATRFPGRYIFSISDGLALALASFAREPSTQWPRVREGVAALVGFDAEGSAAPAVVGALEAVEWLGSRTSKSRAPAGLLAAGATMNLSEVGEQLWSYALRGQT